MRFFGIVIIVSHNLFTRAICKIKSKLFPRLTDCCVQITFTRLLYATGKYPFVGEHNMFSLPIIKKLHKYFAISSHKNHEHSGLHFVMNNSLCANLNSSSARSQRRQRTSYPPHKAQQLVSPRESARRCAVSKPPPCGGRFRFCPPSS